MKGILTCILFVMSLSATAQVVTKNTLRDSLRRAMDELPSGRAKVDLMIRLADDHHTDEWEDAYSLLEEAVVMARQHQYSLGLVNAYTNLGALLRNRSRYIEAIDLYRQAISAADPSEKRHLGQTYLEIGIAWFRLARYDSAKHYCNQIEMLGGKKNLHLEASRYNLLGNISKDQNNFAEAVENYLKATQIFEKLNDKGGLAQTLGNLGNVEYLMRNYEKGLFYANESLKIAAEIRQTSSVAYAHRLIGRIYRKQGKFDDALRSYSEAVTIYKSLGARRDESETYFSIGNIYFDKQDIRKAIDHYRHCLYLQRSISDSLNMAHTYSAIAQGYFELKRFPQSLSFLDSAGHLADRLSIPMVKLDEYSTKASLYAAQKQFDLAYKNHILYAELNDSLNVAQRRNEALELEEKYQSEKKQQEIQALNAANEIAALQAQKTASQRNYLIGLSVLFVVLVGVLYNRYKINVAASRKFQELDRIKTRFFTNISHEFRTPLTLVLGPIERRLAAMNGMHNSSEREELEMMARNARRLHTLINQLLDIAKLDAGAMKMQVTNADLLNEIKIVAGSFASLAEHRSIDYKSNFHIDSSRCYYDPDKIQKILYNLLSNAFKFTPDGGSILFEVTANAKYANFRVHDSGVGIPEDKLDKIFDRFYQVDDSLTRNVDGTGVGLALTKELVELHHGTISVSSKLGQGTIFHVQLPIDERSFSKSDFSTPDELSKGAYVVSDYMYDTGTGADADAALTQGQRPLILVAEDNADMAVFISNSLGLQFQVSIAGDGELALAQALQNVPDLVITDVMMPKMDGLRFCRELKKADATSHIPVIMLTAKADVESKLEGLKTGADDYLSKPFDSRELVVRVANLLEQRRQLQQIFKRHALVTPGPVMIDSPDSVYLNKLMALVESRFHDSGFGVDQLANELCMSRMQLHRKLKALLSRSPGEFLREYRLEKAKQFLSIGGFQVSEAAFKSGFNNLSNFSKLFKEHTGKSPSEYQPQEKV